MRDDAKTIMLKRFAQGALSGTLLLTVSALCNSAYAQTPKKPEALTLNVFSGVFEACFKQAVLPGFEKDTGIKLNLITTQPKVAKLQADGNNPETDVFIAGQSDIRAAYKLGVLADLDEKQLPNVSKLYPSLSKIGVDGGKRYSAVMTFNPTGLIYNGDKWSSPPTTWLDMVSEKVPGVVNVRIPDAQNVVAWLAILAKIENGAWPEKMSDYDGVLKLVRQNLRPKLGSVLPNSGATQSSFVDDPRSALTDGPLNFSFAISKKYNLNIKWAAPKEGAYLITTEIGITKTPNNYWAHQLVNYTLDAGVQKSFAECGFYSPANSTTKVGPDYEGKIYTGEDKVSAIMQIPWEKITPIAPELGKAFLSALEK